MLKIKFTKMVASGNDFVVIESHKLQVPAAGGSAFGGTSHRSLAKKICDRKYGVGADGLLILEGSKIADVRMRIFNPDGSEAEMCGNGARCAALYVGKSNARLQTGAGIVQSRLKDDSVRIKLTDPVNIRLDVTVKVNKRNLKVNFIDTGVPHAVIFVEGLDEIHVSELGRAVRNHKEFAPRGTNVDFVEVLGEDLIGIRTYERGVEDETLACGTGSAASALIFALKTHAGNKIKVRTLSGETLKVYFHRIGDKFTPLEVGHRRCPKTVASGNLSLTGFTDVWLEGEAKIIHKGEYYV